MTVARMIELAAAFLIVATGLWFYVRPVPNSAQAPGGRRDSQGAVLLLALGVIVGIHALGWMAYHPSPSEIELAHQR